MTDERAQTNPYAANAPIPRDNGFAIASLVLGIVGAPLGLIPFFGVFLSFIPAVLAVIFGNLGRKNAAARNGEGRGLALAGLWLGVFGLAVPVLGILWFLSPFS